MTTIGLPNVPVLEGGADPARLDGQDPQSRRIDVWREHERKGAMSRVLIIDDELPIRQVLRRVLEQAGHTVLEASDGRQGMALWRREPVDVVVTDLFMPEKDGVEVLMELSHLAARPKIIAMSGGGAQGLFEVKSTVRCLGADRVLLKPFEPRTLVSTVQEVLDGHA